VLVLAVIAAYSALSLLRHYHFGSSAFDLGIFDQVVWRYSQFKIPYCTIRNNYLDENILSDHFHPILVLLAPLYWFTDGAGALLVAQAVLFGVSVFPVFLFAEKRLGRASAWLFAVSYTIFWGVQKYIEFDFHEIALAVPLIAFAIHFIDEGKRKSYLACLFALLFVKENMSVLVCFFGIYLLTLRRFRDGVVVLALGALYFFAVVKIFIPFFARESLPYYYWKCDKFGREPLGSIKTVIQNPLLVLREMTSPAVKLRTGWSIFSPFLLLAFFSPLFILAVPLLAERFLSSTDHFWLAELHYTATISPLVAMASADGLHRITRLFGSERVRRVCINLAGVAVLLINLYWLPSLPLWNLTRADYWRLSQSDLTGYEALSMIPPHAPVAAQSHLVPHLSRRDRIYMLNPNRQIPEDSEFILASSRTPPFPYSSYQEIAGVLAEQQVRGYEKIFERDGWIVLKRRR
jgi:uncharacterized membrane protein